MKLEQIFRIIGGMSLTIKHKENEFGIGDRVRVTLKIKEGGKSRNSIFEGIVIAIKNRDENKMFTVRKMGEANVGIERIFPLSSPFLEEVKVLKKGSKGVNRAKLYYVREKSPRDIAEIYSRATRRDQQPQVKH